MVGLFLIAIPGVDIFQRVERAIAVRTLSREM